MKHLLPLIVLVCVLSPRLARADFNVRDQGATGDGKTKDTAAFQTALDACAAAGGGIVHVPSGTYLIGSIDLKSNTTLHLDQGAVLQGSPEIADYPLTQIRWEGRMVPGHRALITATGADHITIEGPGRIVAADSQGRLRNPRAPVLIELTNCSNITLQDFSTHNSTIWSIHPVFCTNLTARNLTIRSTGGNGDGIDIDSSQHVTVDHCDIDTGDDCIAIKSGRGLIAYELAKPCSDITITHCTLGDSIFACIGIGSETSGGVSHVTIEHCKFTHAYTDAIYIKSHVGRGAGISDIRADDLQVANARQGFLRINLLNSGRADTGADVVTGDEGIPFGRNYIFSNVVLTKCGRLVQATEISPKKCIDSLTLTHITGECKTGMQLCNITNAALIDIQVTGFTGPLLATQNVTGEGLTDAVRYRASSTRP